MICQPPAPRKGLSRRAQRVSWPYGPLSLRAGSVHCRRLLSSISHGEPIMIGEVIGDYKLTGKLGEGGTGETYLAEHQVTGGKAAAKVLFSSMSTDAALLASFLAEVRAASRVNHVGITDLYDCGVHGNGRAYLLFEYLEGKTLTDALIELGSVTDSESFADIAWQLATLLAAAHASKVVHGALKPDGIFLTFPASQAPRPLVKLLDFGMARFSLSVRHSQTGSLLGAPLYMSPEMSRGLGKVDHRADIYSLGCILFEMACGRPPFVREGKGELIIAHATETPPSVLSLEPTIPQAIDTLVGRMLTKNPATRPQSMDEVAAVLEKFFKCPVPTAAADVHPAPAFAPAPIFPSLAVPSPVASPPAGPSASDSAAFPPRPVARRQDPTALLPPEAQAMCRTSRSEESLTPSAQPWVARVHQRTAILAPSPPVEKRPCAAPIRSASSSISLPIVVVTASLVLAASLGVFLLFRGKPAPSGNAPASPPTAPDPSPPGRAELLPRGFRPRPEPANPLPPPAAQLPETKARDGRRPSQPVPVATPDLKAAMAGKRPDHRW